MHDATYCPVGSGNCNAAPAPNAPGASRRSEKSASCNRNAALSSIAGVPAEALGAAPRTPFMERVRCRCAAGSRRGRRRRTGGSRPGGRLSCASGPSVGARQRRSAVRGSTCAADRRPRRTLSTRRPRRRTARAGTRRARRGAQASRCGLVHPDRRTPAASRRRTHLVSGRRTVAPGGRRQPRTRATRRSRRTPQGPRRRAPRPAGHRGHPIRVNRASPLSGSRAR